MGGSNCPPTEAEASTQKTGCNNGNFGRAAFGVTGQGKGDVVEELSHAALVHDRAEQNEQENIAGGYADGGAVNTFRVGEEVVGQGRPVITTVHKHTGEFTAEKSVNDEDDGQDRQGVACNTAGTFQNQNYQQCCHDQVCLVGITGPFHHAQVVIPDVKGDCET